MRSRHSVSSLFLILVSVVNQTFAKALWPQATQLRSSRGDQQADIRLRHALSDINEDNGFHLLSRQSEDDGSRVPSFEGVLVSRHLVRRTHGQATSGSQIPYTSPANPGASALRNSQGQGAQKAGSGPIQPGANSAGKIAVTSNQGPARKQRVYASGSVLGTARLIVTSTGHNYNRLSFIGDVLNDRTRDDHVAKASVSTPGTKIERENYPLGGRGHAAVSATGQQVTTSITNASGDHAGDLSMRTKISGPGFKSLKSRIYPGETFAGRFRSNDPDRPVTARASISGMASATLEASNPSFSGYEDASHGPPRIMRDRTSSDSESSGDEV